MKDQFVKFWRLLPWLFCFSGLADEFSKSTNTVGDANCFGDLQFTSHLGSIQLSREEQYRFYYTYSSASDFDSPHLGKGFFVPLLEAVLVDHDYFLEATTMGGATIYMYRLPADPNQFVSLNGKYKTTKMGDNRYIRETEEGFRFEYRLGKLIKMRSPKGIDLLFDYDGKICKSILASTGAQVITFSKQNETDAAFTSADGRYHLQFIKYPFQDKANPSPQTTLRSVQWPDGKETSFDYSMPNERGEIMMKMSYDGMSAEYVWSQYNDRLKSADGAEYNIQPLTKEIDYQTERRSTGVYTIQRTFEDGSWKSFRYDEDAGYSEEKSSDGPTMRSYYINTRGPVFNLVRKRERITSDLEEPEVFYEAFYDAEGRLMRAVREGTVVWYLREGGLDESVVNAEDNMIRYDEKDRAYFSRWDGATFETQWDTNGARRVISKHPWGEIMLRHFDSNGNPVKMPPNEKFPERNSFKIPERNSF